MDKLTKLYEKLPDPEELRQHGISFSGGDGYILHNREILDEVLNEWCEQAKLVYGDWDGLFDVRPINTMGMIGRIVSDNRGRAKGDGNGLLPKSYRLSRMWSRFSNIDKNDKEWGQMYYALNEGSGEDVCLNKYFRDHRLNQILD